MNKSPWNHKELVCKLIEFFKENSPSECQEICGNSRLKEDLNLDSLDFVELVMKLEDEYVIKIEDEEVNKLQTIEDVANLILQLKS